MENGASTVAGKRVTLIINTIAAFVGSFMMSAVTVALPTIGKEFAMEAVLLGWVVTAMILTTTAFLLASGRLADIYGRKKIFLLGTIIFTVACFLSAFATSAIFLIACRALQGIGSSLAFTNSVAILTSVFPDKERGRALGISLAATYLGASVGPFLGGVLTQHIGWRSIFLLAGFLNLLVVGLVTFKLKGEWAEARGERFDVTGSVIFGISLVVLMYGFTVLLTALGAVLVVAGLLGMIIFVRWEARANSPILDVQLFRKNRAFVCSNMATLINYSSVIAVIFLLTLYLQYTRGLSPQTTGLIMLIQSVFMTIVAPIAGRLSDRIPPQIIAAVGLALNFVVFLFFFFLTEETGMSWIMAGLALFGLGYGLFSSPNSNAIMGSVERKFLGVASAIMGTMRTAGMMMSMAIAMILFSIFIGETEITPEYYPAFLTSARVGFLIFAAICFGGTFVQLAGRKTG